MTLTQQLITIGACVLGTMLTRFIPFIIFASSKPTPKYIQYLGKVLPSALFGMLIVYSLKDTNITYGNHGIPELIAIISTILIHIYKRNMLLSIFVGTVIYMLLIQLVF